MRALALALAVSATLPWVVARGDDPGEVAVTIGVGDTLPIGPPPVRQVICDDGSVVALVDTLDGPALKGAAPGQTLCSFLDVQSVRRVYRVTVVGKPGAAPPPPGRQ
ncbi:MAG TPA: hypothetical protein VMT17_05765 [Anaeromyxobacteraceae bacterium]|nr:hypothetical protein [Anaeromyxobacteraceae bacterium]